MGEDWNHLSVLLLMFIITASPVAATFDFTIVPKDTTVVVGQRASLDCAATYNNEAPDVYSWSRNQELLSMRSTGVNKLILSNGSLVFSAIDDGGTSADIGIYRCIAEKIGSGGLVHRIASPQAFLRSAYMGEFVQQPADLRVATGDNIMFECKTNGVPAATYSWTKNGGQLPTSDRIISHGEGEVLEIQEVTSSDEGSYQCHAENIAGVLRSSGGALQVSDDTAVDGAPVFSVSPRDESAEKGHNVTLYCALHGLDPDILWLRRGRTIDIAGSNGHYERLGTGSLRIRNITDRDQGKYTCRGQNSVDVADSEAAITVISAPHFTTRPPNVTHGYVNGDVELKCEVGGLPEPEVYWLKDSNKLMPNDYIRIIGTNLQIMAVMPTDGGYYQCIGVNSAGAVYATTQLQVLVEGEGVDTRVVGTVQQPAANVSAPVAPSSLETVLVSYSYITLTWNSSHTRDAPVVGYTVSVVSLADPTASARLRSANTTSTDYTMQGLQPNTNYLFKVSAYNWFGRSATSKELRVQTLAKEAVPSPVRSLHAEAISKHSLQVSWNISLESNGNIIDYRIFYYSTDQSQETNISSTLTSALIDGLEPYTQYHVRVVAFNANGQGVPSEELTITTFSAKPSIAPSGVSAQATDVDSILLSWTPPPASSINGQLTGYKIRYKAKDSFGKASSYTTDADARTYEVNNLEPGTVYMLRVGAVNINGTGPLSDWLEASTSSAALDESRPPSRPVKLTVEPLARELLVSWIPADDSVLVRGYKLGYGTITPDAHWVDIKANERFAYLTNLQPISNYVLQLFAYNNAGDGGRIEQQTFTTADFIPVEERPALLPPLELRARVISSTSVIVTWYDSTLGGRQENIDNRIYTVKYQVVSVSGHRRARFANTSNLVLTLERLRPYTEYEFSVMLSKGKRTSQYSLGISNVTYEDAPGSAPEHLMVTKPERGSNYLHISWQRPSQPNGKIIRYRIYYNTDDSQPLDQWEQYAVAGEIFSLQFGPVTPDTLYYLTIVAETRKGGSPSSSVSIRTPDAQGVGGYGFDGEVIPEGKLYTRETTTSNEDGVVSEAVDPTLSLLQKFPYLLWIIIACVAVIAMIAIAVFIAVICTRKKKSNKSRSSNKPVNQPPDVVSKPSPPDLWMDHEKHELTGLRLQSETDNETDEMTSMLQSNFDVSVSLAGDVSYHDDGRFPSMSRSGRPVIIASNPHREAAPRAAVSPMSADPSRPLYPRTQFATGGQHGSTPRVHVGDTSQPSSEYYHHTPHNHHHNHSGMSGQGSVGGGPHSPHHIVTIPSVPQSPSSDRASHSMRSYHKPPLPTSHVPKHIVKPQPVTAFKMTNQMSGSTYQPNSPAHPVEEPTYNMGGEVCSPPAGRRGSQRRPARQQQPSSVSPNLAMNNLSASREELKSSMMTQSTEQLSAEMAHLDCIMQDLHAIKTDFEMA